MDPMKNDSRPLAAGHGFLVAASVQGSAERVKGTLRRLRRP